MATITGSIKDVNLLANLTQLRIKPRSVPTVIGSALVHPGEITVPPNLSGEFSVVLAAGDYEFWVGAAMSIVNVPDDTNTYSVEQRITSAVNPSTPPVGGAQPTASAAALGLVMTEETHASPVVTMGWFVRETVAAMKGIASRTFNKVCMLWNPEARAASWYRWDAASVADDDTEAFTVVLPDDLESGEPGRWLAM